MIDLIDYLFKNVTTFYLLTNINGYDDCLVYGCYDFWCYFMCYFMWSFCMVDSSEASSFYAFVYDK